MRIFMEVKAERLLRAMRLAGHSVAARVGRGKSGAKRSTGRGNRRGAGERLNERGRS